MDKKAVNKKTWIIIGVVVILLAVLGVGGFMLSQGSADREDSMLQLGQRYLDELNYEQAVVCFTAHLEIDPKSVEAYLGLAAAYEGLQDYAKALEVLEEGYAVTRDDRLMEMVRRLEEPDKEDLPPEDSSEADQTEGYLQEILVLDSTCEEYGSAYGGSIPVKKDGMWGAINYDNEIIVPFEYTGLDASPDNLGNFVLYKSTFTEMQAPGGMTYTSESKEYFLFDNQGNVLYHGEDMVRASGGMYITSHNDHTDPEAEKSLITYHSLDGTVLVSWECNLFDGMYGFYDGISTLVDSNNNRIGTVDLQGNLSWQDAVSPRYYSMLSPMNHGYYVRRPSDSVIPVILSVYDAEGNIVAYVNLNSISVGEDGTVSIDESWENELNSYRGFRIDGFNYWNYGSKMVFIVDNKDVLVDLSKNSTSGGRVGTEVVTAVYDYIVMADENYWLVQSGEQCGYIDHDGNEIALFQDASAFENGYALVKEDGEAWLIDEEFHKLESLGQADYVWSTGELYIVTVGDQRHLYQLR